jgi:hypothetical protein
MSPAAHAENSVMTDECPDLRPAGIAGIVTGQAEG